MAGPMRITAATALAVAVVATFASGAHHNMPSRKIRAIGVFPGVSAAAIERGCAAWKEDVSTCLSSGGASDAPVFTWPER